MTLSADDKRSLSEVRFEKAQAALEDARANLEQDRLGTSVNRSYYAALGAVRSLLILEGVSPESHAGAVTMLSLHFIKTELLSITIVKHLKTLLSRRADVDYGDFESITRDEAEDSVARAEETLTAIDELRSRLAAEL